MDMTKKTETVPAEKRSREQTGVALELDAIKKIGHQLDRLKTSAARSRALDYVRSAVHEKQALEQSAVGGPKDAAPAPQAAFEFEG
jgi:hypothetical protein